MTKINIYSCFLLLFLLLFSCGVDYGNKLESDELDIFYTQEKNEKFARKIALYWKNHDMLGGKKQFLQIDEQNEILILKIIPTDVLSVNEISFDEQVVLLQLQDSLQSVVVPKRLEIVIAKNNFETLFNINLL